MPYADRYPNAGSPEIATSEDAKALLDTMDDMMRGLFPPEEFVNFYENEIGGWDIFSFEVPSWIRERFAFPREEIEPGWVVETFRIFDADGRPARVDDPHDTSHSGIGLVTFSRTDQDERVYVIVHGAHLPGSNEVFYWLHLAADKIEVRQMGHTAESATAEELDVNAAAADLVGQAKCLLGNSNITSAQTTELEALLQVVWGRNPYEPGDPPV